MAGFQFEFCGGVKQPTVQSNIKFLLFVLVDGKEIPFYEIQQNGLAIQVTSEKDYLYRMNLNVVKLFTYASEFGRGRRFHSFYMRLIPEDMAAPAVCIRPFSIHERTREQKLGIPDARPFFFKGKVSFLKKGESLKLLDKESSSWQFLKKQTPLPLDVIREVCEVDRSGMRDNVRFVRPGGRKKQQSNIDPLTGLPR